MRKPFFLITKFNLFQYRIVKLLAVFRRDDFFESFFNKPLELVQILRQSRLNDVFDVSPNIFDRIKIGPFLLTVASCMHFKDLLHDELIGWLIIAHVTEQDANVKSQI